MVSTAEKKKPTIVVLTGAGISAESGLATFRDADGLWEGHDVMQVASPEGFKKDPELVLRFYNERRAQLQTVEPNAAHKAVASLERNYNVQIITQNVDDLHERAGSTKVLHLHGELLKARSSVDPTWRTEWKEDINLGDTCPKGSQLRPDVVWFGEPVPAIMAASLLVKQADIVIVIGTSLVVYPAAGLIDSAPKRARVYVIDKKPPAIKREGVTVIQAKATVGMQKVAKELLA